MKRRTFVRNAMIAAGSAAAGVARIGLSGGNNKTGSSSNGGREKKIKNKLPCWHGFNLLEKFQKYGNRAFVEDDFKWISDLGFDFVRLPMDYRCWTDPKKPYDLDEKVMAEIDQAVGFGEKYKIHVDLNLHRAPGYTVARPPEKMNLWKDEEAQKQFDFQWSTFAKRYRGIPASRLSFDLVNEPARIKVGEYVFVVKRVVKAIRSEDPDRLIIADGLRWGRDPVFELAGLGIAQSTRGYDPMEVSHYQASWVGGTRWAEPSWPLKKGKKLFTRKELYKNNIEPWKKLEAKGCGVHVGECGCYNRTPHKVALAWLGDFMELWKEAGWGWAFWNFRGSFGILDSGRKDVDYEDFHGHKLDRKMLELIRSRF